MKDLLETLDIGNTDLTAITAKQIESWEILTGQQFPRTLNQYATEFVMAEVKKREANLGQREKCLTFDEERIKRNASHIKMGRDFEKMMNAIKANERVKKEWDKFLMFWRLTDPDAEQQ
jgi:hypothetical protein